MVVNSVVSVHARKNEKTAFLSCQRNLISRKNWLTELLTGSYVPSGARMTEPAVCMLRKSTVLSRKEMYH